MFDYERLGSFYLGRSYDLPNGRATSDEVLYDAKDLTTHAVIVGMTGSGKTGLGVTLLEEAAIDRIPSIIIDPKGDMGNLLLQFPELRQQDFEPWVEKDDAHRQGMSVSDFAAEQARRWQSGLADWNQPVDRIARLKAAADVAIYTPGSNAGIPLTILKSLSAPSEALRNDPEAVRDRISTTVSGLLALLGKEADPLRSREHILLANIIEQAWQAGRDLDLAQLIREIQKPPFSRVGVMDLETIFPVSDRMELAMAINNVLSSPAFAGWTQGEPLDIQKMLYADDGRPRMAIVSIAHLSDRERMFFVTLLLNEVLAWMRSQPGTSSLRAILYMDEVFGYLPPSANPPSKTPMLTLLKQARAFGLGLVLATQNPVDLDYKALSNAGTWFLGRLQTERDKLRVLDGLEGAATASGAVFNRQQTEQILSGLRNRVFLMNNVHDAEPVVFQVRWALSYLRGPITRDQIQQLMAPRKAAGAAPLAIPAATVATRAGKESELPGTSAPPLLPAEIHPRNLPIARSVPRDAVILYQPALVARARVHYVDAKAKLDIWQNSAWLVPAADGLPKDPWDEAEEIDPKSLRDDSPPADARYAEVPGELSRAAAYRSWATSLKNFLYRERLLTLSYSPELKMYSNGTEREGDFRARLTHPLREKRDLEMEKVRKKYESRVATLRDKLRRAEQKVETERQQANSATMTAAMTFGSSILGALFGRKKISATNVGRATTTMRSATRAAQQRGDIARAEDNVTVVQADMEALNAELQQETERVRQAYDDSTITLQAYEVTPRKSDLSVEEISLLWLPYQWSPNGRLTPAYDDLAAL